VTHHARPPTSTSLRLRPMQPLIERDGSCPLVYDLERALLVEVPEDFRWHAAPAIENGDLDDGLLGWLAGEDLWTCEGRPGPDRGAAAVAVAAGRRVARGCEEIRCQPAEPSVEAVAGALDALVRRTEAGSRIVLLLVAEGELARPDAVRRAVATARQAARSTGRSVGFELTTDGRGIGAPFARFLAEQGAAVRLTADGPALGLLLAHLPERLTFCPVLDTGDRLLDCWRRSRDLGLRRLAPVKLTDRPLSGLAVFAELRQYRHDLFAVADDLADALGGGWTPQPLHEPLARVVRRHVAGRPPPRPPPAAPECGPAAWPATELGSGGVADCSSCWAADLCSRNLLARPRPGSVRPRADRCELWRAEVEVGLLLCRRLEALDPTLPAALADRDDEPIFDAFTSPLPADLHTC